MLNYTIRNRSKDAELLIYPGDFVVEFAREPNDSGHHRISKVRLILASGVVVAMTMPQFTMAVQAAEQGGSFAASVFSQPDTMEMRNFLKTSPKVFKMVSPAYFTIHNSGVVEKTNISGSFSQDMTKNGTLIMPLVTYEGTQVDSILTQGAAVGEQLLSFAKYHHLDGVIFNFPGAANGTYTAFLQAVSQKMEGKKIGVVVYPARNTYEYQALNILASHILVNPLKVRAEQSISPYYSVTDTEKQVKKVIKSGVEQDKLVIALDLGGRIWGAGWDGSIPTNPSEVGEITNQFAVRERYDKVNGAVYLDFTIRPGHHFEVGGKRLYAGNYVINMGSSTYAREVLMLVNKLGVKGATLLHMPLGPSDLWDYYHTWLGGGYFEDISGTFGRDEIMRLYVNGVMQGVGNNRFMPYSAISRGEAAAIVARMLQLPQADKKPPFSDIGGHWAEQYITSAYFAGHMIGDVDGTFKPEAILTREQAAVLIARISGIEERHNEKYVFTDVPPDSWSYESIMAMHRAGMLKGYGDGTFKPKQNMTREEIAILIDRLETVL